MQIKGRDLHARQQTLAMLDTGTGEAVNRTLPHEGRSVREFCSTLPGPVCVGIEATGSMKWFLHLMEELGIDCQVDHRAGALLSCVKFCFKWTVTRQIRQVKLNRQTQVRFSVPIRSLEDQFQGLFTSENCFHHAAVDPQRRTIGGRRKLAGQISHHCRNFIHGGKALQ
jgi:hypothetical protein